MFTAVGSEHGNGTPVVLAGSSLPGGFTGGFAGAPAAFTLAAVEDAEYEPVMLFINHSCEPNVGFAGNTVLGAMRDISPGEELTTDYALFDDYDGMTQCRCGTPILPRHDRRPGLAAARLAAQVRQLLLFLSPAPASPPARPPRLSQASPAHG